MADLLLYNECGEAVPPLPSADMVGPALMLTAALAMHLTNVPMLKYQLQNNYNFRSICCTDTGIAELVRCFCYASVARCNIWPIHCNWWRRDDVIMNDDRQHYQNYLGWERHKHQRTKQWWRSCEWTNNFDMKGGDSSIWRSRLYLA